MKVYKVFFRRWQEAHYQLSQKKSDSIWEKNSQAFEEAGGRRLLL